MARPVPVIDDVTLESLYADPYPIYRRLRHEAPVAYLSAAGINLVTRFDDIIAIERDHERFPANDPRSLMIKAMGHTLMRKDGHDHRRERMALEPTFRPGTVKTHWGPIFEGICNDLIDRIAPRGRAARAAFALSGVSLSGMQQPFSRAGGRAFGAPADLRLSS
jgi:cytochrome P450